MRDPDRINGERRFWNNEIDRAIGFHDYKKRDH